MSVSLACGWQRYTTVYRQLQRCDSISAWQALGQAAGNASASSPWPAGELAPAGVLLRRDLADFEADEHRQCIMHKARATLLEPAAEKINPQAYASISWSLRLEIAAAYREIMLIKEAHKRPYPKARFSGVTWAA